MNKFDIIYFMDGWNKFWEDVWNAFSEAFKNLGNFWLGTGADGQGPFIASFIFAILVLIFGSFLIKLILFLLKKVFKLDKKIIKEKTVKNFIINSLKVGLYIGLFLIVLTILRVDLSGAAQIFSSAILAVGLALQDVISNFASGIIILTSKPFVIGDYVNIGNGECEGTITNVKFLVTSIETVDKQVVTIPNKTITGDVIMNYTRNPLRRLKIDIGVDYATDIEKAKNVLVNLAKEDNRILQEPAPVCYVTGFGASSISLSLRCYVPNEIYWTVLFSMNEKLLIAFNENNINIPFNRLVVSTLDNKNLVIEGSEK